MGLFSKVDVSYDKDSGVLTVHGEENGSVEGGGEMMEATRAVSMPCGVSKPEMISAEALDGRVIVTVPHDAQAPVAEKKLENKKLDVRLFAGGQEQKPLMAGESQGTNKEKKDVASLEDVLAAADE